MQTHASAVFLTGDLVYKIKKPVYFGFLDYRSLEARRRCCEAEVALNRRLCPEVYLDVVPVVSTGSGLRIGAAGETVEWAVRMRQLPEADLLSERLRAGTVSPDLIRRLAGKLARFHQQADRRPEFGALAAIRANVEENFAQTEPLTGEALPPEHLAAVQAYAAGFLERGRGLFEQRLAGGWIRDGHGDLRAQNICLSPHVGDGIQVLDCIEFNNRFRCGDTAADLAYLAMDLDLAGRADLRDELVRAYAAESSAPDLLEVLPFYLCYRAYVRGKIALFAAGEAEIPAPERGAHSELAAAAFDLSRSYAALPHPVLVAMVGYSGSGKSVLARELARRLPAVRLSSDEVRKELAGAEPESPLPVEAYTAGAREAIYTELRRRAVPLLQAGMSVLLDATFLAPEERAALRALAAERSIPLYFVECRLPELLIRERLQARRGDASDASIHVYEAQTADRSVAETLSAERGSPGWIQADTSAPPGIAARRALEPLWAAARANLTA